jgi:diguanylate cyclase (GGDEF)-like protein
MNWSVIPDIAAAGFLAIAFASVLNRNGVSGPSRWLIGWLLIVLHFIALVFAPMGGFWGDLSSIVATITLLWAGVFFMWRSVPYRSLKTSRYMLYSILFALLINTICIRTDLIPHSLQDFCASLFIIGPVAITALAWKQVHSPERIFVVTSYGLLGLFLIYIYHHPDSHPLLAYAPMHLLTYLLCSIYFSLTYRQLTAGRLIMISGMYLWAAVFIVAHFLSSHFPAIVIDGEVWNLPKYIVAVGMILLLLENQVKHNRMLALHDELTGLPNRRLFQDRLASAIERARRSGTQTALLMIDLDHFKSVNDTHGHAVGDQLLKKISNIFEKRLRRIDTVARTGGDEFSIILECPIVREDAENVANSLLAEVREPLALDNRLVQASFSLGIALYPADAADAESLYIAADTKMYESKATLLASQ